MCRVKDIKFCVCIVHEVGLEEVVMSAWQVRVGAWGGGGGGQLIVCVYVCKCICSLSISIWKSSIYIIINTQKHTHTHTLTAKPIFHKNFPLYSSHL